MAFKPTGGLEPPTVGYKPTALPQLSYAGIVGLYYVRLSSSSHTNHISIMEIFPISTPSYNDRSVKLSPSVHTIAMAKSTAVFIVL